MIGGSARKGRFSIFTDIVYLSMSKNGDARVASVDGNVSGNLVSIPVSADLTLNTRPDFDGLLWTLAAGYTVSETDTSSVDLFAESEDSAFVEWRSLPWTKWYSLPTEMDP